MGARYGRREFVRTAAAGSVAVAHTLSVGACRRSESVRARRPNIFVCISDDQSHPHASAYGCRFVSTPGFDRIAREGMRFDHAFVSTPSCSPSRGSILAGQDFYRLGPASMNHTVFPSGIDVYTDLLSNAGYHVGHSGKGCGPADWRGGGRTRDPAGTAYNRRRLDPPNPGIMDIDYPANFADFLEARPSGAPFCFWYGAGEPHRGYAGGGDGSRSATVDVPSFLPDVPQVRRDLLNYGSEIEWYDRKLVAMLDMLEARGELDDTLVIVTSDNGMPFPRAKGCLYDYGTRMPLAVRWGTRIRNRGATDAFVSLKDIGPTVLDAAGLPSPSGMNGTSLVPLMTGDGGPNHPRDRAVFGIERHLPGSRTGGAGYPSRAIRTAHHLYIRNLTPDRSPVGDHPGSVWPSSDPTGGYGDIDGGPTKTYLWEHRDRHPKLFALAFGPRPAEELYDVREDPANVHNLAGRPELADVKRRLSNELDAYLASTGDPRAVGRGHELDDVMRRFSTL